MAFGEKGQAWSQRRQKAGLWKRPCGWCEKEFWPTRKGHECCSQACSTKRYQSRAEVLEERRDKARWERARAKEEARARAMWD